MCRRVALPGSTELVHSHADQVAQPATADRLGGSTAGQRLANGELDGVSLEHVKIVVDDTQATSLAGVWAGGDCVVDGEDLTVSAVQHGKVAAQAIDRHLRA